MRDLKWSDSISQRGALAIGGLEVKTARLLLSLWSDEYLDDLVRIYADPEVKRYVTYGRPLSRKWCAEYSDKLRRLWEEYG